MKKLGSTINKLYPIIFFIIFLGLWEFVVEQGIVSRFVLPSPTDIFSILKSERKILLEHLYVTLFEALVGLSLGIIVGITVAILMERFELIKRIMYPVIILTQTVPTIAIAPLLVLWLGYDILPKVVLIVLTTFYPVAVGVFEGFQSIDEDYIALLDSMGAREFQIFKYLKIPATASNFFSALKISASYSVVGAVISEWLGGFRGLGVYMTRVKKAYAFDKMFAVIIIISLLSLVLIGIVNLLRRIILKWEYVNEE